MNNEILKLLTQLKSSLDHYHNPPFLTLLNEFINAVKTTDLEKNQGTTTQEGITTADAIYRKLLKLPVPDVSEDLTARGKRNKRRSVYRRKTLRKRQNKTRRIPRVGRYANR